MPLRIILASICLWLLTVLPAVAAGFDDGYQARTELQRQVLNHVAKNEFVILEKQADGLRRDRSRFTDGGFRLNAFYQAFAKMRLFRKTDEEWLRLIADLEAWQRTYPLSVTARTSLAWGWYGYGWFARGNDYADTVTDEGWKLFRDRLRRAYELAREPGTLPDCPERYNLLLHLANSLGWDDKHYEQIFREAAAFDPDYHEYYVDKATRLLPRWGGAPGAWLRFAEEAMEEAPTGREKILYAWIVSGIQYTGELQQFKESGVSWPTLRQGYRDMLVAYPGSPWATNRFAMFACLADDRETMRELLTNPDFIYNRDAWPGVDIDSCRTKAGLPSMQEIVKERLAKQHRELQERVFKEACSRAGKGDRLAMAMVGEMYFKGDGVQRDDAKAYAWLVLSGERRDLLEEVASTLSPDLQQEARKEVERLRNKLRKGE